ncbi:MAG: hypothetical protein K1V78_09480 [Muribaculaceae bacterium]
MLRTFSISEFVAYYRQQSGLAVTGSDCSIEVTDGIAVDGLIADALRRWYAEQLDTADPRLLPVSDVGSTLRPTAYAVPEGACRLVFPASTRRIIFVQPESTGAPAVPQPADALDEVLRMQDNPYTAATAAEPEAVAVAGSRTEIYLWPTVTSIASAMAVIDPGSDTFVLDEILLSRLPALSQIITHYPSPSHPHLTT